MTKVIKKVGGIILNAHGEILVVRKVVPARNTFIIPGGKPEGTESEQETLARELFEELGVKMESAEHFGNFIEPAEFEDARLEMSVYTVVVSGDPEPQSEIVEAIWVGPDFAQKGYSLGSTLANHVIPELVELGRM